MQDNISYEELLKLGIAKKEQSGQQQSVKVPFFLRKQVAKLNQQKIPKSLVFQSHHILLDAVNQNVGKETTDQSHRTKMLSMLKNEPIQEGILIKTSSKTQPTIQQ